MEVTGVTVTAVNIGQVCTSPDHLIRNQLVADKQGRIIADQFVTAIIDHVLGIFLGQAIEIGHGLIFIGPGLSSGRILGDVLAERGLIQEETGSIGFYDILADHGTLRRLELVVHHIFTSEDKVLGHLVENELAVIAGAVEDERILRLEVFLHPRHIREEFDTGHVVVCTPETGHTLVVIVDFFLYLSLGIDHVFQHVVGTTEEAPARGDPGALARTVPIHIGTEEVRRGLRGNQVVVGIAAGRFRVVGHVAVQHAVGIHLKFSLRLEIGFGIELIDRTAGEEILTGGDAKQCGDCEQKRNILFHISFLLRKLS